MFCRKCKVEMISGKRYEQRKNNNGNIKLICRCFNECRSCGEKLFVNILKFWYAKKWAMKKGLEASIQWENM